MMPRTTFDADIHCDNCGHRGERALSARRHAIDMGGGRWVIPANGPTMCPHCCRQAVFTRLAEDPAESEDPRRVAKISTFRFDYE
jgi:hypothetical protein